MREAVRAGALSSAHDIAEGGLAVALAECCLVGGVGAQVELPEGLWEVTPLPTPPDPTSRDAVPTLLTAALFGEGAGRLRGQRRGRRRARAGRAHAGRR